MARKTATPKKGKAKAKKMPPAKPASKRLHIADRHIVGNEIKVSTPIEVKSEPTQPASTSIVGPAARHIIIEPIRATGGAKSKAAAKPAVVAPPVVAKPAAAKPVITPPLPAKTAVTPAPAAAPAAPDPTPPEPTPPTVADAKVPDSTPVAPDDDSDLDDDSSSDHKPSPETQKALQEAEATAKREQELQTYIENRQFFVPINAVARKRSIIVSASMTLLVLMLALVLVDLLLDSGAILLLQKIPHTHFFSLGG